MVIMAPFETFSEHAERIKSKEPYSDVFIHRCRAKALEYDREDIFLRTCLLTSLKRCLPLHQQSKVFEGISF